MIAIRMMQTVDLSGVALLILVLIVYADTVAGRAEFGPRYARPALQLTLLVLLSMIPLALAAAAALVEIKLQF